MNQPVKLWINHFLSTCCDIQPWTLITSELQVPMKNIFFRGGLCLKSDTVVRLPIIFFWFLPLDQLNKIQAKHQFQLLMWAEGKKQGPEQLQDSTQKTEKQEDDKRNLDTFYYLLFKQGTFPAKRKDYLKVIYSFTSNQQGSDSWNPQYPESQWEASCICSTLCCSSAKQWGL